MQRIESQLAILQNTDDLSYSEAAMSERVDDGETGSTTNRKVVD